MEKRKQFARRILSNQGEKTLVVLSARVASSSSEFQSTNYASFVSQHPPWFTFDSICHATLRSLERSVA